MGKYKHKRTGGIYEVICTAYDTKSPTDLMVVYRNVETGETWIRSSEEFNDGRFQEYVDSSN